jgi:hypothetical protein
MATSTADASGNPRSVLRRCATCLARAGEPNPANCKPPRSYAPAQKDGDRATDYAADESSDEGPRCPDDNRDHCHRG